MSQNLILNTIKNILSSNKTLQPFNTFNFHQPIKFYEARQLEYIIVLLEQVIPKLFLQITNPEKQNNWENYFNFILPQKHLNFSSQEEYLAVHNIKIIDVIQNSILKVFPDIHDDDLIEIATKLIPLMTGHKIRILEDDQMAVYLEIVNLMEYIRKINQLIDRYKKPHSNYRGTAHRSSSLKDIINKQIRMLEERLNGAYFRIQNEDEKEQTLYVLKILKLSLKPEHKNLMEQVNLWKIIYGFDMKFINASKNEQIALEQVTNFYNGAKTKPHELVRSVMIYIDEHFNKSKLEPNVKAEIILFIIRFFFKHELEKAEKGKNTLAFNKKHIGKEYRVKTFLHNIPIYVYQYKNDNDFLKELIEIGFSGMMGLQNIIETDKPIKEVASWIYIGRNIIEVRETLNLTKKEFKAILYFASKDEAIQEQNKLLDISTQI